LGNGSNRAKKKKKRGKAAQAEIRKQVLDVKRKYPFFGVGRVWGWMRRRLFVPVTQREVRETLKEENLLAKPKKKKRKKQKPRRFERARPNQMWQSDITTFTIARGVRVYLIGFMDDHSRYVVGWGLYTSQSSQLVIDVLKSAFATYGHPKEMLTDNGRQYVTWRGKTDFQRIMQDENIRHIRSRKQHPQTLGKIESFWGKVKAEWLAEINKSGLEDMRRRLGHYINWWNFERPHEGIADATPAERFFQYGKIAREEIEEQLRKNEKDLAFADPDPEEPIGAVQIGEKSIEVKKSEGEVVVIVDGQDMKTLNEKEQGHEAQENALGQDGDRGQGSEGKGGDRAGGALGGEDGGGGVPRHRDQSDDVLQAGGTPGEGDAGDGEDAAAERSPQERSGGGGDAGDEDGGAQEGAPKGAEPDAGVSQAPLDREQEKAQKGPGEAQKGRFGKSDDDDDHVAPAGQAAPAGDGPDTGGVADET
jgi:transposase InsO family protein